MRIVILVDSYLPKWTAGTEVATFNVASRLAARGHHVHVITRLDKGLPEKSVEMGVCIHRIWWPNLKFIGLAAFCLKLLYVLKTVSPQVVHIQSVHMGLYGLLAKGILDKPYVVWSQGYAFQSRRRSTAVILRYAAAVIALSDDMKIELQRVWPREVLVVPNGVNVGPFKQISRERARRALAIGEVEKIVMYVGRLAPVKGVQYLIDAMRCIRQTERNARLLLVGDGSERARLELLAKDLGLSECVTFIGRIPNDRVPLYLVASDVFVLPSLSEGLSLVCLEAMAAALPIVATRVGGIPSLIDDGVNGLLVDSQSAAQIADKVSIILNDQVLRDSLATNNQAKAQQYTWETVVSELESIYFRCCKAR